MKFLTVASAAVIALATGVAAQDECPSYQLVSLVNGDKSIRPFKPGSNKKECIYKRYQDYVAGHELWLWNCADIKHKNKIKSGKYKWRFNEDPVTKSGTIESVGSSQKDKKTGKKGPRFCWTFHKPDSEWKQRVKLARCIDDHPAQKWRYIDGRIMSVLSKNLCMGYETAVYAENGGEVALTMMACFHNHWGMYETQASIDKPRGGFYGFFNYNKKKGCKCT